MVVAGSRHRVCSAAEYSGISTTRRDLHHLKEDLEDAASPLVRSAEARGNGGVAAPAAPEEHDGARGEDPGDRTVLSSGRLWTVEESASNTPVKRGRANTQPPPPGDFGRRLAA